MARVLVLVAHPNLQVSHVNRVLIKAARAAAAQESGNTIEVRDLYHLYPDFVIDVDAEQAALATADLVVWQHPIHWYSMPPLMKLWLDDVLRYGWAYGENGHHLSGKDLWLVTSTGGTHESYHPADYNRYFFEAFMPPYEQTAVLCGMRWLPPLIVHGAHRLELEDLKTHATTYAQRLASYPAWPEIDELGDCATCVVPPGQRPQDRQ